LIRLADEALGCSDRELAGHCAFFFIAASESTAAAIAASVHEVLRRPALRAELAARPQSLPAMTRELVRLASPIQYVVRQMTSDIEVGGQQIAAGEPIFLMLGAANRDPAAFPHPDEPDPALERARPVDFAAGPYRCVGSALALLEVETAIRTLLRYPRLTLTDEAPVWAGRLNIDPLQRLAATISQE
jgi:pimeloyl-[acyl-carrier protein] synthase